MIISSDPAIKDDTISFSPLKPNYQLEYDSWMVYAGTPHLEPDEQELDYWLASPIHCG